MVTNALTSGFTSGHSSLTSVELPSGGADFSRSSKKSGPVSHRLVARFVAFTDRVAQSAGLSWLGT